MDNDAAGAAESIMMRTRNQIDVARRSGPSRAGRRAGNALRVVGLFLFAAAGGLAQAPDAHRALLLISIDGLRPDYVLEADKHGLKIPRLRALARDGSYATRVRGVLPSATYPSHTSIITGVAPAKHGIVANHPFDGAVKDLDVWYYYAEDLHAPTLWGAAAAAGYVVGNVSWPVTVGAPSIRFNIPEFNLTRTNEDVKLTRGAATPGLMAELAEKAGPYLTDSNQAVARDWTRTRYARELLRLKRPNFLTVHLVATDHLQHRDGPFAPSVIAALEEIDQMVGQLTDGIRAIDPGAAVCIVSDHGFAPVDHVLYLDAAFVKAGLITLKGAGKTAEAAGIAQWTARTWSSGGSAAIVLKNPTDTAARAKVKLFLDGFAADPANGIAAILDEAAIRELGGAPTAHFWVDLRPGFSISGSLAPSIVSAVSARGSHGYAPTHREMGSTFILAGEGIRRGVDLGEIDMRSIAPTLARFLGVPFPSAEAAAQEIFTERRPGPPSRSH